MRGWLASLEVQTLPFDGAPAQPVPCLHRKMMTHSPKLLLQLSIDFSRRLNSRHDRTLHPSWQWRGVFASKPHPSLRPAYLRIPLHLTNRIQGVCAALPGIAGPRFGDYGFKVSPQPGMHFIHVADDLLKPFSFA